MKDQDKKLLAGLTAAHSINDGFALTFPTLLPLIAKDLNLSYIQIGNLIGITVIILSIGQILMGIVSDKVTRYKKKTLISFGIICLCTGLLFIGMSNSYIFLILAASVVATGESIYHPVGVSMLSQITENKGKVFSIHGAGGGVGMILLPLISGIFTEIYGWRFVFQSLSIVGIIIGIFLFLLLKDPDKNITFPSSKTFFTKEIIIVVLVFGSIMMIGRGFTTFFPLQLYELKYSPSSIGLIVTIFYGIGIAGQYAAKSFIDKENLRNMITYIYLITSFFLSIFIINIKTPETYVMILLLIVVGFFYSMMWPMIFAHYTDIIPKYSVGKSLGIFFSISGIMGAFAPIIMGNIVDLFSITTALLTLPITGIIGATLMLNRGK